MTNSKGRHVSNTIGCLLLVLVLFCNEYVLACAFSNDGEVAASYIWIIRSADVLLLSLACLHFLGRRLRLVFRLDMVLVATGLSLLAAEGFLRVTEHDRDMLSLNEARIRLPDPYLHHKLAPNADTYIKWGDRVMAYRTNNLGQRDAMVRNVLKRTGSERRVLVLGDSFAECLGVNFDDGFVKKLERLFMKSGQDVEILTSGVVSYSPSLEFRALRRFVDEGYSTDSVLMLLDISDIDDEGNKRRSLDARNLSEQEMKEITRARSDREEMLLARIDRKKRFRLIWPRLVGVITSFYQSYKLHESGEKKDPFAGLSGNPRYAWTEGHAATGDSEWVERGIEKCMRAILKLQELCSARGFQFAVVIYPYPVQLAGQNHPSMYQTVFSEFAEENGIVILDLFPAFVEKDDWRSCFIKGDIHWNEKGHTVVADILYSRREDWLRNADN